LFDSLEEIDYPTFEAPSAGVGEIGPDDGNLIDYECVHGLFHLFGDGEETLDALIDLIDGPGDFCQEDGHVFDFLYEHVLIGSFLVGVHLVLDLIDGEDHAFDVDVLHETFDHSFDDVLGGLAATVASGTAVFGCDFEEGAEEVEALGGSEADFGVGV
jgi:hypothetical protein